MPLRSKKLTPAQQRILEERFGVGVPEYKDDPSDPQHVTSYHSYAPENDVTRHISGVISEHSVTKETNLSSGLIISRQDFDARNRQIEQDFKTAIPEYDRLSIEVRTGLASFGRSSASFATTLLVSGSARLSDAGAYRQAFLTYTLDKVFGEIGVCTQVLGFTTKTDLVPLLREKWKKDGEPADPGRTSDLRHIVLKSWSGHDPFAGILVGGGGPDNHLRKNSVTGEALLWAESLEGITRNIHHHLIVLIGPEIPHDQFTNVDNKEPSYLVGHLRLVAHQLGRKKDVTLLSIDCGKVRDESSGSIISKSFDFTDKVMDKVHTPGEILRSVSNSSLVFNVG